MIYRSIQNVLVTHIIRRKIENKFNQIAPFYQGDLVKKKKKSPLKYSGVMINARAIIIDHIILLFTEFTSMFKNYLFLRQRFYHSYRLLCALQKLR